MVFRALKKSELILIRNKIAKTAIKFFQKNYSKEGKMDKGFTRWKVRKKETGKPLLYKTGKMKKAFKITYKGADSFIIKNTANYSGFHNEGDGNLPKREILYDSEELWEEMEDEAFRIIEKTLGFK